MSVMTHSTTRHTHYVIIDGEEYQTEYRAAEHIDPKVTVEGDTTTLVYAALDEYYPESPIEEDEFSEFKEFRTEHERNIFAAEKRDEGWHVFFVNHYEHSMSSYTVIDPEILSLGYRCDHCATVVTSTESDTWIDQLDGEECGEYDAYPLHEGVPATIHNGYRAGWDDRPSGVLALAPGLGSSDPLEVAQSVMETYTSWVNGDVYLIVNETYVDGEQTNCDVVCGFIGSDYAQQVVNEGGY